jgi:hypothetical protein
MEQVADLADVVTPGTDLDSLAKSIRMRPGTDEITGLLILMVQRVIPTANFQPAARRLHHFSSFKDVGLAMIKQLSVAIIVSMWVGSGLAWSGLQPFVFPPAETKIDFNRTFSDFNLIVARRADGFATQTVNRVRKGDRLPSTKSAVFEPIRLPYCEPVASPFADPVLGRVVGRCDA